MKIKFFSLLLLCLSILFPDHTQAQSAPYSKVKVHIEKDGLMKMANAGIAVDHGDYRPGVFFTGEFSSEEVELIKSLGLRYEMLISDLSLHFKERKDENPERISAFANCFASAPNYTIPSAFTLGSMGGFFTYSEMLTHLDNMANLYPNLITIKQPINSQLTFEGRPVYYVKISDNPNVNEAEPGVLYSAVHHAREPMSMSQLIFYMYYLLENYGTDPLVSNIINETEMYFVPCLNPDGYIYNQNTNPNGGGYWRKNRKDNLDGQFGVDLNRNYDFNWGYDNFGSSPFSYSDTYRGTAGFSEPETQMMRDLCNTKQFKIAFNYHSYSNLLIYPWGYDYSIYTPDSARFVNYGELLTRYNKYVHGTADQTVGYIVNGSSDDWMYGEQNSKPEIFAMTPEVGTPSDGFWPATSRILPLCLENVWPNINLALLAGKYAVAKDESGVILAHNSGHLKMSVTQIGIDTTGTYTLSLVSLQPSIVSTGSAKVIGPLNTLQSVIDSISYHVVPGITFGTTISFVMELNNGSITFRDTLHKVIGAPFVNFANDASSTFGISGDWGITNSHYVSAPSSFTDSPSGNYLPNSYSILETASPISLNGAQAAYLKFKLRYEIEPSWDYAQVLVSSNGGLNWDPICGKYTKAGSDFQIPGEPIYDGFQLAWVDEEMSLEDYLGMNVLIRFEMLSDSWTEFDGIYMDDMLVEVIPAGITGFNTPINQNAVIEQNIPNPSLGSTFINYSGAASDSYLNIIDALGRTVYKEKLNQGSGAVQVNTTEMDAGVYFYFIEYNGQKSHALKMMIFNKK